MKDPRFGSQDYQLNQPLKTLEYAKALQLWADLANPTPLGESCQLAECIKELRHSMEPFTTFTEAQVFDPVEPSNWVRITPISLQKPRNLCPFESMVAVRTTGLKLEA